MSRHHGWLHRQIGLWLGEGLIDAGLADALRHRYPEESGGWGRFILSGLGAVIFGLGAILLIAFNWELMGKSTKLAIVFASLILAHGAALQAGRRGSAAAEGLHALGTTLFGAAIWLVAQIYHIEGHYPDAMLIWGLGALALAWALPSVTQGLMAVALVLAWQSMELFDFGRNLHGAPWLLLVGVFPLFWRLRSGVLGAAALLALLGSVLIVTLELDAEISAAVMFLLASAGIAFARLVAGQSDPRLAATASAFSAPSHAVFLCLLYLLCFPDLADTLFDMDLDEWRIRAYFFGAVIAAGAFWLALLLAARTGRTHTGQTPDLIVFSATVLAVYYSLTPQTHGGWLAALSFNVLTLIYSVMLIVAGSRQLRLRKVVVGCLLLAMLAAARYVDLFDSLLARAMVFFVVGGLLFAVGNLYSRQKRAREGNS